MSNKDKLDETIKNLKVTPEKLQRLKKTAQLQARKMESEKK